MSTAATIAYWVVLATAWGGLQQGREGGSPLRPSLPSVLLWGGGWYGAVTNLAVLAVTALGLVHRRGVRVLTSLVVAAGGLVLLLRHDQHGLAAGAGLGVSVVCALAARRRGR